MRLGNLVTWFSRQRHGLASYALLLAAVLLTVKITAPVAWSVSALLAPFVLAALVKLRWELHGPTHKRLFAMARRVVLVGAASTLIHRFWNGLPWSAAWLTPVWLTLLAASIYYRPIAAWTRQQRGSWESTRRYDWIAAESVVLAVVGYLGITFLPDVRALPLWIGSFALWPAIRLVQKAYRPKPTVRGELINLSVAFAGFALGCVLLMIPGGWPNRGQAMLIFWMLICVVALRLLARAGTQSADTGAPEIVRWLALPAIALWAMRGFATQALHGTGDAQWYATMVADMIAQVRDGVFPVWLGQSEFQFNGAIYPLRVAPLFHYSAAILDVATWQILEAFALQNLLITMVGVAATTIGYVAFRILLPSRPWLALGFTALFFTCPGVVGIPYISDMYMSWTTLPWLILAWLGNVLCFRGAHRRRALLLTATCLGFCWWGHSPIAIWATLITALVQAVRWVRQWPTLTEFRDAVIGGIWFLAIAAYPVGSVLFFPPEPAIDASSFQEALPINIVPLLREAFPGVLLPLSERGRGLADLQLGYAVWMVWVLLPVLCWRSRSLAGWIFWGISLFLILLLNPFHGLDLALWGLVPSQVRDMTGNWVMNRLYLIACSSVLFAAAATLTHKATLRTRVDKMASIVVAAGCAWSFCEIEKFHYGSKLGARTVETSANLLRPENLQLTRFAYLVFPKLPPTFSHGAIDPQLEHRVLAADGTTAILDSGSIARAHSQPLTSTEFAQPTPGSNVLELQPPPRLEPGKKYLQTLTFQHLETATGVLEISGDTLARVYELPHYGGTAAFGVGGSHRDWISLSTSNPAGEAIRVRFLPPAEVSDASTLLPFGRSELREYDPGVLPVTVLDWIPYRAAVRSSQDGWLETPRMYQQYFGAQVNGAQAEVQKSGRGFAMVRIPTGNSTVELRFVPPLGLATAFWTSALAVCAALAWGGSLALRAGIGQRAVTSRTA